MPTKLDRRRQRSRDEHREGTLRHEAFRALQGVPRDWPPGVEGESRVYRGQLYIFHNGNCRGCKGIPPPGLWFIDKA